MEEKAKKESEERMVREEEQARLNAIEEAEKAERAA